MQKNIQKNKTLSQQFHYAPPCVSIIIVQYNNSKDAIRCLNSIKELDYPNYSVIIIDNNSDVKDFNATRLFMESLRDERFKIIHSYKNFGYAGGNNLGIKKAIENVVDYVFILNPDTIIERNTLTKLVEASEADPQIGIVGPAISEGDKIVYGGKVQWYRPELEHIYLKPITHHPEKASGVKPRGGHATFRGPRGFTGLKPNTYLVGAAILIKRAVIEKIGLLDERYFLYFEDPDYCIRANMAGYKLAIVPEARVSHTVSASTSQLGSALLLRYHFRNAHLFNLKNGPWYIKIALPFWSVFIIIKQLIKLVLIPNRRKISNAILTGVADFYKGRFGQIKI